MGQEIEYKLKAQNALELDAAYCRVRACTKLSSERNIKMFTQYFDTPEGILRERHWTLRIRRENNCCVLTCKTPGKDHSRGEWELIRSTDTPAPTPEELRVLSELGAPEALCSLENLKQVCGACFVRRCTMLDLPDARIELAADTGELFGASAREALFELELELYDGNADRLSELAKVAALPEEVLSKQARAMRLL